MLGELIHQQVAQAAAIRLTYFTLQPLLVDLLDRVPMKAQKISHMLDRQDPHEDFNVTTHRDRHVAPPIEPVDLLVAHAASRTDNTTDRYLKPDPLIEQIAFTHPSAPLVVDLIHRPATATTLR